MNYSKKELEKKELEEDIVKEGCYTDTVKSVWYRELKIGPDGEPDRDDLIRCLRQSQARRAARGPRRYVPPHPRSRDQPAISPAELAKKEAAAEQAAAELLREEEAKVARRMKRRG